MGENHQEAAAAAKEEEEEEEEEAVQDEEEEEEEEEAVQDEEEEEEEAVQGEEEEEAVQDDGRGPKKSETSLPSIACCECGIEAVMKVVGPRSENRGLRYLSCRRFVFFGKKDSYCRFFEWVDPPRLTKEQKTEARRQKQKKGMWATTTVMEPSVRTRSAARKMANQCNSSGNSEEMQNHNSNLAADGGTVDQHRQEDTSPANPGDKDLWSWELVTDTRVSDSRNEDLRLGIAEGMSRTEENGEDLFEDKGNGSHGNNIRDRSAEMSQDADGSHGSIQVVAKGSKTEQPKLLTPQFDERSEKRSLSSEHDMIQESLSPVLEAPSCLCSQEATLKTVKSRGPNKGLRFWVCPNSHPFYAKLKKKKQNKKVANRTSKSCKFFRWIDTPVEPDVWLEEAKRRKEMRKRRELSLLK